jgi:hypothetical protein
MIRLFSQSVGATVCCCSVMHFLIKISPQNRYAELVGVSRRTLTDIEQDKGNQAQSMIDTVFKPFGIKSGLTPIHPYVAKHMMSGKQADH